MLLCKKSRLLILVDELGKFIFKRMPCKIPHIMRSIGFFSKKTDKLFDGISCFSEVKNNGNAHVWFSCLRCHTMDLPRSMKQ